MTTVTGEHLPSSSESKFEPAVNAADLLAQLPATISERRQLVHPEGAVSVLEVRPAQTTDIPTFVAPGFAETPNSIQPFMSSLAEHGRRLAVGVEHSSQPREIDVNSTLSERYGEVHLNRAREILAALDAEGTEQVDMVGHSQGCIDVVVAARLDHERGNQRIRTITLMNPAGTPTTADNYIDEDSGRMSKAEMAKRAAKQLGNDVWSTLRHSGSRRATAKAVVESAKTVAKSPLDSYHQADAILRTNILDDLKYLREEQGIGVGIVAGINDKLFPMDEYQNTVKVHHVDAFYSVRGSHNEIVLQGEKQGQMVAGILQTFAKRPRH